jgi:apolipoprotein N-acyltransferase
MSREILAASISALLLAAPFLVPVFFSSSWIAFVPLFWLLKSAKSSRRAIVLGWLTGFFAHLIGFHWLVYTITVFGGFPYPASVAIF